MNNINLQKHEIQLLKALKDGKERDVSELKVDLDQVAVARAAYSLKENGLAKVSEKETIIGRLSNEGKNVLNKGLPEKRLVREIKNKKKLSEIKLKDKNIAVGWSQRKGFIKIKKIGKDTILEVTKSGLEALKKNEFEEKYLERINKGEGIDKSLLENLKKRRFVNVEKKVIRKIKLTDKGVKAARKVKLVKEISQLTPSLIISGKWKNVKFRKYNVLANVKEVYPGKRHFVVQAAEYMRKIYLEMGFKEMEGPLINTSFWNFDALFTAQDHPVRDLQDTFYISNLKGKLPSNKVVNKVKMTHEKGTKDSCGWQYKWSPEEAKKIVLRTHTTVLSAKTLAQLKKDDWPAKYFAIGKCFRNETLDWSHLFEFNQFEGIVIDENANFKHLLGYLKEFFKKLGFAHARYRPAYFPYTEMSVEIDVLHPVHKKWIELGGAGIFRPEVVEPLLGEWVPVLAWGPGFDRILMDYYNIMDMRNLYKNDIKQMRKMKQWMW